MQLTFKEQITIVKDQHGNLQFCRAQLDSQDALNPNLVMTSCQDYLITDSTVQSLLIEFDKLMTAIKQANGVE